MGLHWWLGVVCAALLDLVVPGGCCGCHGGAPGVLLCTRCRLALAGTARVSWPDPVPSGLPPPWSVAPYDGPVRAALLAYKEDGRLALARPMAAALCAALLAAVPARADGAPGAGPGLPVLAVPVPSASASVRARGHDPLSRLARASTGLARAAGVPVRLVPALRLSRRVADQSGLGALARAHNVGGAHAVRPAARRLVAGRAVVLVDDIVTTGSTLAEAARALRGAGAEVVSAATIAATARRAATA